MHDESLVLMLRVYAAGKKKGLHLMHSDKQEEASYTQTHTGRHNYRHGSGGDGEVSDTDADKNAKQIRQRGGWDKSRLTDARETL